MFKLVMQLPPRDLSVVQHSIRVRFAEHGGGKPIGLNTKRKLLWLVLPGDVCVWLHIVHGRVYSETPDRFFAARERMHPPREAMIAQITDAAAQCPWHRPPSFDK